MIPQRAHEGISEETPEGIPKQLLEKFSNLWKNVGVWKNSWWKFRNNSWRDFKGTSAEIAEETLWEISQLLLKEFAKNTWMKWSHGEFLYKSEKRISAEIPKGIHEGNAWAIPEDISGAVLEGIPEGVPEGNPVAIHFLKRSWNLDFINPKIWIWESINFCKNPSRIFWRHLSKKTLWKNPKRNN